MTTSAKAHLIAIDYLNAYCGAGKTFEVARYANEQAQRGNNVLIVQPTKALIAETVKTTFPACGIPRSLYTEITGNTHPNAVNAALRHHLSSSLRTGEILLITHQTFFSIGYFPHKSDWIIVIDEVPQVDVSFVMNLPETHKLLTDHIAIVDRSHTLYHRVEEQTGTLKLSNYAKNPLGDDVAKLFADFAKVITSPSWSTYVLASNYNRLVEDTGDHQSRQLLAFGLRSPTVLDVFKKVVVAAACFTDSLMYLLWKEWKDPDIAVVFTDITDSFNLRYTTHNNGHLVDIYYGITGRWSKTAQADVDADGITSLSAITNAAAVLIGTESYAWFANADVPTPLGKCDRLPNVSHGLNTFQHINHVIAVSALNPTPAHFNFLKEFAGIDADIVQTAMTRQAIYQAICRTSIRDITNLDRKIWVVPDRKTAEWLQQIFVGAAIHDLGLGITKADAGRPRVHADDAARSRAFRQKKADAAIVRHQRRIRAELINGVVHDVEADVVVTMDVADSVSTQIANIAAAGGVKRNFLGTIFDTKFSRTGEALYGTFDDLVGIYREYSGIMYSSKGDCPAYSPSLYVANSGTTTSRGYDNIAYTRHIILDVDGGTMMPEDFATVFPAWRMFIHSSWSHTSGVPKYRVVIATSCPLDVDGYKVVTSHIADTLKKLGWYNVVEAADPKVRRAKRFLGVHGLDRTKLNPACVLFVPSQGADPSAQFFHDYREDRAPLDAFAVLAQAQVEEEVVFAPVIAPPAPTPIKANASPALMKLQTALLAKEMQAFVATKAAAVSAAATEFSVSATKGNRDAAVFALVIKLRNGGCDHDEVVANADDAITSRFSGALRKDLVAKAKRAAKKVCR
ncbi:DEAD/DEAH box helicase family protein [Methylobacterium sp. 37f]|uniref:DEAD/DEAH box helicase family protein n=1 Tax=Methylobacterium sp. 37f TaxID=2817058 RepID=UPI001FFD1260|nr:DEAD/DEAH box helicase family protein [Methylobacterium sp. 37f]MCK2056635.1 DEAD/DEAH box helicase family protein [Methylobacterium sp. 37f]